MTQLIHSSNLATFLSTLHSSIHPLWVIDFGASGNLATFLYASHSSIDPPWVIDSGASDHI